MITWECRILTWNMIATHCIFVNFVPVVKYIVIAVTSVMPDLRSCIVPGSANLYAT